MTNGSSALRPCSHCPVRPTGLPCPAITGRRHGRLCALHERDAALWGPAIVELAIADSDQVAKWEEPRHRLLAPLCGTHLGTQEKKPWDYRVTATFAHLGTPELAALVVGLLRLQTEPPYILVVDTGSSQAHREQLEQLRAPDCEIHYLGGHAYQHSSDPVGLACDLAMDRCQTDLLFFTHADCFLRSRDLLARWADLCGPENPLRGYQITDRSYHGPAFEWRSMVGHTATMVHVPTAWRIGARWGYRYGQSVLPSGAVWDTEYGFNTAFRRAGIAADLVGTEVNFQRNVNADFDHVRSAASSAIYAVGTPAYRAAKDLWLAQATDEARARIRRWSKRRVPLGTPKQALIDDCVPCREQQHQHQFQEVP